MNLLNLLFGKRGENTTFKQRVHERGRDPRPLNPVEMALMVLAGPPESTPQPQVMSQAAPPPPPSPTPQPQVTADQIAKAIQVYGGQDAPLLDYANQIAQASQKYEFLEDNPYLIPAVGHLETSSGRNVTRPNNLLNWGINFPGNNEAFQRMTQAEVLSRALSGLGQRSGIYDKFRTGDPLTDEQIMEFAQTYEPANASYPQNLLNAIRQIESQVNK